MGIKTIEELKKVVETNTIKGFGVSWTVKEITITRELALELLKKFESNNE